MSEPEESWKNRKIGLIHCDASMAEMTELILQLDGHEVINLGVPLQALPIIKSEIIDLVILLNFMLYSKEKNLLFILNSLFLDETEKERLIYELFDPQFFIYTIHTLSNPQDLQSPLRSHVNSL